MICIVFAIVHSLNQFVKHGYHNFLPLHFLSEMNLCRLLLQCGIEACFCRQNENISTMGASLSSEIAINAENMAFSDRVSMQGVVRCVVSSHFDFMKF